MNRTATCHCGDLRVRCEGEPRKVSMCHCFDCQRRSGSPFSVAVFYSRSAVTVEGSQPGLFERTSASGHPIAFAFCRQCGSNVYWEPRRMPDLIAVGLGAFADPQFPPPSQSVWTKDKHAWLALPESLTAFHEAPVRPSPKDERGEPT